MKKEYMSSIEELKSKFPLGSIRNIDDKYLVVKCFTKPSSSHPRVKLFLTNTFTNDAYVWALIVTQ